MNRPFTDITKAKSDQPLKNGTIIGLTTPRGTNKLYNFYVNNTPTINDIYNKYGNKFYNGLFVELAGNQIIVGG
jgi:hypothetical protein